MKKRTTYRGTKIYKIACIAIASCFVMAALALLFYDEYLKGGILMVTAGLSGIMLFRFHSDTDVKPSLLYALKIWLTAGCASPGFLMAMIRFSDYDKYLYYKQEFASWYSHTAGTYLFYTLFPWLLVTISYNSFFKPRWSLFKTKFLITVEILIFFGIISQNVTTRYDAFLDLLWFAPVAITVTGIWFYYLKLKPKKKAAMQMQQQVSFQ
jgi:hypothetical protein